MSDKLTAEQLEDYQHVLDSGSRLNPMVSYSLIDAVRRLTAERGYCQVVCEECGEELP